MKKLRWEAPERPIPKHPYRDSALLYGGFAALVVVVAWATGGNIRNAAIIAAAAFVIATGWSWWRWRERLAARERKLR